MLRSTWERSYAGDTTVGPFSKVGGEVSNSVFFGNSNKAHDGYLGNSVIGEWCNLGAGTNSSNLKNNYDTVKLWNHAENSFKNTGLQFCGLMMGDHSKVVSARCLIPVPLWMCALIFLVAGFLQPIFLLLHGVARNGFTIYKIEKALETINKVMSRRNADFSEDDKDILLHLFKETVNVRV